MPGIIGLIGEFNQEFNQEFGAHLLKQMAAAVKHEPWYQTDLHHEQGCGLGRIGLGFTNAEAQPVWNAAQTLGVVMEGELYETAALKQCLQQKGVHFCTDSDAELLLHLYAEEGEEFAKGLNGAFVVAVWDRRTRKLVIATDRMATYPIYYAHHRQRLLFAPNVHALLVDPALDRTVDRVAIAQALTFDHMLGAHTWLTAVQLMPPASILVYAEDRLELRPYWTLKYPDSYQPQSEQEYLENFLHLLRQAVKRQSGGNLPVGMMLSGGLDSRLLAAVMRDGPLVEPLHTYTWGIPDCDDARYAKALAHELGIGHHFVELAPDYLLTHADQGVRLTNGSNCVHYHALAALAETTQATPTHEGVKVLFKGVMGDAMMGTALTRHFWADYDLETQAQVHFQTHYARGVVLFTPDEQTALFTDDFRQMIKGAVMASYQQGMAASQARQLADQRIYFDLRQRIQRMTWNGVELTRSQVLTRIPYADNDVVDFATQLPPGFRFERYLMKKALTERYVDLAQIPYTETGLPLTSCAQDIIIRLQRWLAWHSHRVGLRATPTIPKQPYADYDLWFRTVLRNWLGDTLLQKQTLARGYFNPSYVRQLVTEQFGGANHAVKLGALVSLELWHRQFLD